MNMPEFTAEASLNKTRTYYHTTGTGTSMYSAIQMQAKRGTFGDGPKRWQLPGWFICGGTSIDIETCHSCFDTSMHGTICVCYDCDRGSGDCTPGYVCTDIYGFTRPPGRNIEIAPRGSVFAP